MSMTAPTPRAAARRWTPERPARLAGFGALILALSAMPYMCGYLLVPPGKSFLGALNNVGDLSQYIAAIRQGTQGAWRYTNQFSPDHARRLWMYTAYLLMGHVALGLSPPAAFQLMRLCCGAVLLYALARFCKLFVGPFALRACWLFVVLAGGLYWLALPLSAFFPGLNLASLTAPELSPLITLLNSPHESLALAAELLGFVCILRASGAKEPLWADRHQSPTEPAQRSRFVFGAAMWFLVLALTYPFLLPTVVAVLLTYAAIEARSAWTSRIASAAPRRRLRASEVFTTELRAIAAALTPAGLVAVYYFVVFHTDALWSHSGLVQMSAPSLTVLIFGFGMLALAAAAGARRLHAFRRLGADAAPPALAWFPLIWAVVNGLTLLLPIWQQGRQVLGLSVPLALLSFLWLAGPRVVTDGLRTALPMLRTSVLAFSSPLLLALYTAVAAAGPEVNANYYAPSSVTAAVSWLGDHAGPSDVVLASAGFGNLVPEACSCQVVAGQDFETFNLADRQAEIRQFYGAASPTVAARVLASIVSREAVTIVVYSPYERAFGPVELHAIRGFQLRYDQFGVQMFMSTSAHG